MTSATPPDDREETAEIPSQRRQSATAKIVALIGTDRPSRIIGPALPPPQKPSEEASAPAPLVRPALVDTAAGAAFCLVALLITKGLWAGPRTHALAAGADDQILAEWFLSYGARVYSGDFSLVTERLNAPDGVNLLSNASVILLGVLLGPVTLAFGAAVSFAVATAGNLAATAIGWYLLFARTWGRHRAAAAFGAALAGFAPGMIAQSYGHPHITAQWLVPAMVWCVVRICQTSDRRQLLLTAALLGFLVTLQFHLGPEVLYLTAVGGTLFLVVFWLADRAALRERLPDIGQGFAFAGGITALLLAYPLWVMFGGPQAVHGGPYPSYRYSLDAAALVEISPVSLAGDAAAAAYSPDVAELNGYFGVPLLLVILGATLWLLRRPVVIAASTAGAGLLVLALGPRLVLDGEQTDVPLPYALVDGLPVISAALPGRLALAAVPMFAALVTLAVDQALRVQAGWTRLVVPFAVACALAPIAPVPMRTVERPPVPRYFTQGWWRGCAGSGGGVLVPVPLPEPRRPESMRWATAAGTGFALPQGSFIGPYGPGGEASLGTFPRPTSQLLARVAETGEVPVVGDTERSAAIADALYWNARCFVLADRPHREPLRTTMNALFGPGQSIADVDVWPV
ncbi:hypothetical protein Val02_17180 [Virgisporangium aliadipatigenens]|uniref:DUF6311 domain-containing protein n=1 Tax=Virgisporangium aliadipatigenens TaxID=741659 RepID=A0A8J4DPW8_9ACTN|nr:hypothetical protein [Virgisporangium aliadipatigenens]GIJ44832.1 hypothetical protein Val02_17180 [Virgisporangium aliadipatigenens]